MSGENGRFPESHQLCPSAVVSDNGATNGGLRLNSQVVACDGSGSTLVLERQLGYSSLNSHSTYLSQYGNSLLAAPTKGAASSDGTSYLGSMDSVMSRDAAVYSLVYKGGTDNPITRYDMATGKVTKLACSMTTPSVSTIWPFSRAKMAATMLT